MGKPKKVSAVRLDADQLTRVQAIAFERRVGVSALIRQLVDVALGLAPGQRSPFTVDVPPQDPHAFFAAPLLAEDVGAGEPRLEMIPGADRRYGFREDWLKELGWRPEEPDRFGVYRLADLLARSMEPTIQAGSLLLVDRGADRDSVPDRSVWIVRHRGGLVCKRVTMRDGWLVLESDNRDPEFAPDALKVTAPLRRNMLEGRVVWWATTVE